MSGARFVRQYPSDWRSGCLGLSLVEEGLYCRICNFISETGRRVPLDDAEAARMLGGCNFNQYVKVRNQLLAKGKIKHHADGYGNDRAERELAAALAAGGRREASQVPASALGESRNPVHPQHEDGGNSVSGRELPREALLVDPVVDPTPDPIVDYGVSAEIVVQNQCPSIEPYPIQEKERTTQRCVEGRAKAQWEIVSQACMEALGAAADPMSFGLIAVAEPQSWIAEGASLELDIVPAIRAAAAKQIAKGLTVSGWNYFAKPVAQLKANRLAGLPAVKAELAKPAFKMGRYGLVRVVEAVQ